jgi:hypothetical protein
MDVTNSGVFTTDDNADITVTGQFTQDGTSTSSLGGNLTATAGMNFARAIALTGTDAVVLATGGASGQNIVLGTDTTTNITGSGQALTLNAGNLGNITINGHIGTADDVLGAITITNANLATFAGVVTAASFTQSLANTTTGATTFNSKVATTNNFAFTGRALTLNAADNSVGGAMTVTNSGVFTTADVANLTVTGDFEQIGTSAATSTVTLGADVTSTTGLVTFGKAVTLESTDLITITSGAGTGDNIAFLSTVTSNSNESLTLNAGADGSIQATGAVNLGTGNLTITDANNAFFSNQITAGRFTQAAGSGQTGLAEVLLSDSFAFTGEDLTINGWIDSDGSVTVTNAGTFTTLGNRYIIADQGFTQNGQGTSTIGGNITTTDTGISFATGVTIWINPIVMNTGAGAGNITFSSTLNGSTAGAQNLTLTAGTGDITFTGIAGGATRLGAVTINQAAGVTISQSFSAASFNQPNTTAGTGTFLLNGNLDTNVGAVTISSATVDLNANITTTAGGANGLVTINAGAGGVDLADTKTITTTAAGLGVTSGAIDINSVGSVNLVGNLVTTGALGDGTAPGTGVGATGGAVTIDTTASAATITLSDITTSGGAAAASSDANGGAAGTITLTTHADGVITLDNSKITAAGGALDGTGSQGAGADITFGNAVALTTGAATINTGATAGNIAFNSTLNSTSAGAQNLTLTAGTGNLTFSQAVGNTNALGAMLINSANQTLASSTINAANLVQTTGTLTTLTGNVTTTDSLGVDLTSTDIRLDGLTINTATGNGIVRMNGATRLDDDVIITRGTGAVTFTGTVDSQANETNNLTIDGANGATIAFQGNVGAGTNTRLGAVTIATASGVTVTDNKSFSAVSFEQQAGSGATVFGGTVNTSGQISGANTNGIDISTAGTVQFKDTVTTTGSGAVAISNAGTLTIDNDATFNLAGAFDQSGGGSVNLGANITTADAAIGFANAITLTNGVTIDTGCGCWHGDVWQHDQFGAHNADDHGRHGQCGVPERCKCGPQFCC